MISREEFEKIKEKWRSRWSMFSANVDALIEVGELYFDTEANHVVISRAEYDVLVQRSHRLEELEL